MYFYFHIAFCSTNKVLEQSVLYDHQSRGTGPFCISQGCTTKGPVWSLIDSLSARQLCPSNSIWIMSSISSLTYFVQLMNWNHLKVLYIFGLIFTLEANEIPTTVKSFKKQVIPTINTTLNIWPLKRNYL